MSLRDEGAVSGVKGAQTYTAMSKSGGGHRWSRRKRPPSLAEIELSRTVVRRANNSHGSLGEAKP